MAENFNELAETWDNESRRVERARVISEEIIKNVSQINGMSGFEYGCGTGLLSFNLQSHLKHITLGDNSQGMLDVLTKKIENAKIKNMTPLLIDLSKDEMIPDRKFDIVYTMLALHHITDIDKVIGAFAKMLNPLGYVCIIDLDEEDGSFHGPDFTGHNGFDRNKLAEKLTEHGFGDISYKTCYENVKRTSEGIERKYPMFLMIGKNNICGGIKWTVN